MKCFSEIKYSMYVDGELDAGEARLVEAHLFACPRCRTVVNALRKESRLLAELLQEPEAGWVRRENRRAGWSLLWTAASAVALVLLLDALASWLPGAIPGSARWLNPLDPTTLMNLLFSAALYVANEGAAMFEAIYATVAPLMLGLVLVGLYYLLRRRVLPFAMLTGLALCFAMPRSAVAIEFRHGGDVTVPTGQTVDGTLIVTGQTINIDGTVNGDLLVSGKSLVIRGTVKGDVLTFVQTVDLDGSATGNLFSLGQWLSLRGTVERNLYCWVQTLQIEPAGRVGADAIAGSAVGRINGSIGRDAVLAQGTSFIRGSVGRNLRAFADNFTLEAPARIGGDLTLKVHHKNLAHIDPTVVVGGKTTVEESKPRPSRYVRPRFYFREGVKFAAALITGLALFWIFPALFRAIPAYGSTVLKTAGVGFLGLVATPVAALVLGITLVGLPIALLGLAAWLAVILLAKVFVAGQIGQNLLRARAGEPAFFAKSLLLGLAILYVAANLPYVGGWISLLIVILALGVVLTQAIRSRRPALGQ